MHREVYELPKLKMNLTPARMIVVFLSVFSFLVLPIYFIENAKISNQSVNGPRVAGESIFRPISSQVTIPVLNLTIDLNTQPGVLILAGIVFIGIAIIIGIFLIIDNKRFRDSRSKTRIHSKYHPSL